MKKHSSILFFCGLTGLLVAAALLYPENADEEPGVTGKTTPVQGIADRPGHATTQALPDELMPKAQDNSEKNLAVHQTPKAYDSRGYAPSLMYTQIDGHLAADAAGNLIIEQSTKDFFDYFLTAVGEVSLEEAIAQMQSLAESSLPKDAAEQAMTLLQQYLAYEQAKQAYLQQPLTLQPNPTSADYADHLQRTFDELKRLRREHLGDEAATTFFAMEEAYGDYTVEAIRIQTDTNLAPQEKRQRLQAQVATLPEPLRANKLEQIDEDLRAQAGLDAINRARDEPELRQKLAAAGFPADKAEDLVRFWYEDKAFQSRYQQYDQQRQKIETAGLASLDQEKAIEQLRLAHFSSQEELTRAKMRDLEE